MAPATRRWAALAEAADLRQARNDARIGVETGRGSVSQGRKAPGRATASVHLERVFHGSNRLAPAQCRADAGKVQLSSAMLPCPVQTGMSATLDSLATPIIVTASPDTTARQAAQLMRTHHVGSLVVVDSASDSGKPVGIVTDRDLVLAVMAEGLDPSLFTVGDIMSIDLVTVPASANLIDATHELRRRRVRRLIVLDDAGRVVGLAALEDLLEALARELGELVLALRGARDREIQERR
jgi:CBS domain-containing protein